jgi:hypothetical protein
MEDAIEANIGGVLGTYHQRVERDKKESKMGIEKLEISFIKNLPTN